MLVLKALAAKAFSRIADTKQADGNAARLLRNGNENYPLWLAAIAGAKTTVHLENYLIQEDPTGRSFADALIDAAGRGVRVRVIYDWFGCRSKTSAGFWEKLRAAGVEVRCYNRPHLHSPLGWISRDHRKVLCVDGQIGFTGGLCIGQDWAGNPAKRKAPWRDTAVEIRGPAVAHLEMAFADSWAATGAAMPQGEVSEIDKIAPAGDLGMLVIAGRPDSMGLYRLEQLIAETAEKSLWLADAYFVATTGYVRALSAAARDGVDVRILVPGSSNIPIVRALSLSSYRPLIEAGVRVFEWNGPMMHAKTAVADGCWARVGSSNSNLSSWIANRELDVTIQDADFAKQMETMFEHDLENATEIVLDSGRVRSSVPRKSRPGRPRGAANASMGRVVAGAVGFGSAMSASLTQHRTLGASEARVLAVGGALLLVLAAAMLALPALIAYPLALFGVWVAATLFLRAWKIRAPAPRSTSTGEVEMKIVSWNLLHRSGATLDEIEHLIRHEKPDLLLMQEALIHIDALPHRVGGHYARNPLPGREHGLAAWSPAPMHSAPASLLLQPGLFVRRVCQIIEFEHFGVANVHLSHGQWLNRRQLRRIVQILPPRAAVLGDCNLIGPPLLPGFRDVGPRQGTHAFGDVMPLRLDRCFVRGLECESAAMLARATSDHHPIMVRLSVPAGASKAA